MSDPILDLLAAPPNPAMSVDEQSVYAGGRRRLRRRALRRTGFGAVGIVGAAAIAFGALGSGVDNDALPAGPSPAASTPNRVSAELLDGRFAVEVRQGAPADQPNVVFYAIKDGKRQQLAGSSADADVVSVGTGSGAEGVMLGTAPADAMAFLTVAPGAKGGIAMDQQILPGTDYQAVALTFENPTDVDTYRDTIWRNQDYEVRNGMGERLPTTTLAERDTFFVDREGAVMGIFNPDGGWTKSLNSGAESTTMGYGKKDERAGWTWRSVTLLPAGTRDVKFTWAAADYTSDVFPHAMSGTKEVVAMSDATGVLTESPRVTSVTYTDAAGTRHTEAVK